MVLVVALILAVFVVPSPWGYVLFGTAFVWEVASTHWQWHWSRRQPKVVGPAALVGKVVEIGPDGWARVGAERWRVRGAGPGERARVVAVDGLTLVVERV